MNLVSDINHVAIVTADLDRFVDFYVDVFGMEVVFEETTPAFRHAMLRTANGSVLHPASVVDNPHGAALPDMFDRGHLDHLALTVESQEAFDTVCRRLVERQASTGLVEDLGPIHSVWFQDPDGMSVELCVVLDPELRGIHAPEPLEAATG